MHCLCLISDAAYQLYAGWAGQTMMHKQSSVDTVAEGRCCAIKREQIISHGGLRISSHVTRSSAYHARLLNPMDEYWNMIWRKGIAHKPDEYGNINMKGISHRQAERCLTWSVNNMLGEPLLEQPLMFLGHGVFGAFLGSWSLRLLPEASWWVWEPDYCSRGVAWVTCNVTGCADSHPNQVPPPQTMQCNARCYKGHHCSTMYGTMQCNTGPKYNILHWITPYIKKKLWLDHILPNVAVLLAVGETGHFSIRYYTILYHIYDISYTIPYYIINWICRIDLQKQVTIPGIVYHIWYTV